MRAFVFRCEKRSSQADELCGETALIVKVAQHMNYHHVAFVRPELNWKITEAITGGTKDARILVIISLMKAPG